MVTSTKARLGIERRVIKVSAVRGISTALSIGLQLVSVPVCLRYWGNDTYGTWLALSAAFIMMRTVDGGYIAYVGNRLNIQYHADEAALRVTLASAIWGTALLGMAQLALLVFLYSTESIGIIINSELSPKAQQEIMLALTLLSVSWMISGSYIGIVHRIMIPAGLMYQAEWWSMGFQVSQAMALLIAAMLGLSIVQAAFLFALVQVITYMASAVYLKLKLPSYFPWWSHPDRSVGFRDLLRSMPFTFGGILQQGGNSGQVMLVSAFLGPAAVPAFATVKTLSNLWTTLINLLTSPLLPEVVRFHAMKDEQKLLVVHQAHWLLMAGAVNLSILIAFPFLDAAYSTWTRHHLLLDKPLLDLLLSAVSLAGMSALMNTLLSGLNHFRFVLTCAALRGGLALLLGMLLLPSYGTAGLGFAVLSAETLVLGATLLLFFRHEMAIIGGEGKFSVAGWSWVSSVCVVVYLLADSVRLTDAAGVYWFALAGTLIGNLLAWRRLNADIKTRVLSLFPARRRSSIFRWWS